MNIYLTYIKVHITLLCDIICDFQNTYFTLTQYLPGTYHNHLLYTYPYYIFNLMYNHIHKYVLTINVFYTSIITLENYWNIPLTMF